MFSMAMWMAVLVAPIQILAGDQHGLNTLRISAGQGHGDGGPFRKPSRRRAADPVRLAEHDGRARRLCASRSRSSARSILTHSLDAPLKGLEALPREDWPPVPLVVLGVSHHGRRWAARCCCSALSACGCAGAAAFTNRRCCTGSRWRWGRRDSSPCIAGWIVTEVGRQPFTVYGLLRTADSPRRRWRPGRGGSLAAFVVVYFIVFGDRRLLHAAADGDAAASRRGRDREQACRCARPASRRRRGVRGR